MYRLIYKSRSVSPMDWDLVRSILAQSEKNNQELGLTGALLASRSHFLQVIEGRYEDVNAIFRHIVLDERHTELFLVGFSVIDYRLFSDWAMRGIGAFDFNQDIEERMIRKYGEEEGGIHLPFEEWQALALFSDISMLADLPDWKTHPDENGE